MAGRDPVERAVQQDQSALTVVLGPVAFRGEELGKGRRTFPAGGSLPACIGGPEQRLAGRDARRQWTPRSRRPAVPPPDRSFARGRRRPPRRLRRGTAWRDGRNRAPPGPRASGTPRQGARRAPSGPDGRTPCSAAGPRPRRRRPGSPAPRRRDEANSFRRVSSPREATAAILRRQGSVLMRAF